jgi:serine/threonine-protein phosphatase 5
VPLLGFFLLLSARRGPILMHAGEENELVTPTVDLNSYHVDASYDGPRMKVRVREDGSTAPKPGDAPEEEYEITAEFVKDMMTAFRTQKKIHIRFVMEILIAFQNIVKQLPSLVDVAIEPESHITVCGDTHGQYFDLMHIFDLNGLPSIENPYVFNGDFVDRGSWSVEVILTLMAWKVLEPACVHLTRGNHEALSLNKIYGFEGEVKAKYNQRVMDVFRCASCKGSVSLAQFHNQFLYNVPNFHEAEDVCWCSSWMHAKSTMANDTVHRTCESSCC